MDIFIDYILHKVGVSWILTHRPNWHTVGMIAGDVLRYDVGAIPLYSNAVVACVSHGQQNGREEQNVGNHGIHLRGTYLLAQSNCKRRRLVNSRYLCRRC